jgi:hypothetical protein
MATAVSASPRRKSQRGLSGIKKINQRRDDEERQPARQRHPAERVGIPGQQRAHQRQHGEGRRERDLVDRAECAAVLRGHQLGGNRERRRYRKAAPQPGQQAKDDELFGVLREWDEQREEGGRRDADRHDRFAAAMIGDRRCGKAADADHRGRRNRQKPDFRLGHVQWRLGQQQQRAGHHQVVAVDKADQPKHHDDHQVVAAERDAVELAPQRAAGRTARPARKSCAHGGLRVHAETRRCQPRAL